jgi:hypothetical protein
VERGSNLNIPDLCKGTLLYYAVRNNNMQCIELWVQLGTTVNYQGQRTMKQFSMALVMEERGIFYSVVIIFILINGIFVNCSWVDSRWQ